MEFFPAVKSKATEIVLYKILVKQVSCLILSFIMYLYVLEAILNHLSKWS
jgi:hypothetical protein